jgi:hypothetical protein
LYTASRDRFIKLWEINYNESKVIISSNPQSSLRANFDEHTDWVN